AIGGPTVGFITGRSDLIEACELQHRGIARSMKVGKEQIMGLMAALDVYTKSEAAGATKSEAAGATESEAAGAADAVLNALVEALSPLPGIDVSIVPDRAGRPIRRVGITSSEFELAALVGYLRDGSPSIRTRNHQLDEGYILLDTRELRLEHVPVIADRIQAFVRG
ncbi:MAG: SelA-like pyridoxal phosphate-dependent enzyme, partial [Gammaproteobacteria bacterium]|nr:SelA-like pyridoxal phosphate-dependent enzyme [Gammaproteobacteria bacterium]